MNNLFSELKCRNIFRVAGVYAVVGWMLMQVAALLENSLNLPTWFDTVITAALLLGFPISALFAWAFEMTPEGVKRTENVEDGDSITDKTGRKLDYTIIGGLVLVGSRFMPQKVARLMLLLFKLKMPRLFNPKIPLRSCRSSICHLTRNKSIFRTGFPRNC